jgi:hypothetical protein
LEDYMPKTGVNGKKKSGVFYFFLAFGGALFTLLKKIGVTRTGGMVDTWDD